jgi:anti-sigma B factor antagonist
MDLAISSRSVGNYSVVAVEGEVDVYSAPALDEVLSGLIAEGNTRLIIDLTEVGFLDSTGLGVLVKALKRVREADGSLAVVTASERVLKVFRITGLDVVMSLVPSVDQALATDGS